MRGKKPKKTKKKRKSRAKCNSKTLHPYLCNCRQGIDGFEPSTEFWVGKSTGDKNFSVYTRESRRVKVTSNVYLELTEQHEELQNTRKRELELKREIRDRKKYYMLLMEEEEEKRRKQYLHWSPQAAVPWA